MFEINSKPKKLTVQKHSKANLWTTKCVLTKGDGDKSSFTEEEVKNFMSIYSDGEDSPVRVLNEHGKVILSTASEYFCTFICEHTMISVGEMLVEEEVVDDKGEKRIDADEVFDDCMNFTAFDNPRIPHIREFQRYIARRGGIKRWTDYPQDETDGFIRCGKLTFKDGTSVTVSYFD